MRVFHSFGMHTNVLRLDGLNKSMDDWDVGYYGRVFNGKCREIGMTTIDYPQGKKVIPLKNNLFF